MPTRPTSFTRVALLAGLAVALAGCAAPQESADTNATTGDAACAPAADQGGESGHPPGTTGSGTGDITTADGGDPSRPDTDPSAVDSCIPPDGTEEGDRTSTGLGDPGGGVSTRPE